MHNRVPIITTCLIGAGLLVVATFVSVEQKTLAAQPAADPAFTAHSAHVAADASQTGKQTVEAQLAELLARIQQLEANTQQQPGQSPAADAMPMGAGNPARIRPMPGMGSTAKPASAGMASMNMTGGKGGMGGGPPVADQMAELRSKMQRLEATMQHQSGSTSGAMPMSGKPGMGPAAKPMQGGMAGMSAMGAGNPPSGGAPGTMKPAGGMGGMGGGASPQGGQMGMMGMMDKMMGMMGKMMGGMGGGAMPAGAPMGGAAPGGGMGMMDMDKMEMAGMMGMMGGMGGKGGSSMAMPSALPGFPGASHLYHLGAMNRVLEVS